MMIQKLSIRCYLTPCETTSYASLTERESVRKDKCLSDCHVCSNTPSVTLVLQLMEIHVKGVHTILHKGKQKAVRKKLKIRRIIIFMDEH